MVYETTIAEIEILRLKENKRVYFSPHEMKGTEAEENQEAPGVEGPITLFNGLEKVLVAESHKELPELRKLAAEHGIDVPVLLSSNIFLPHIYHHHS